MFTGDVTIQSVFVMYNSVGLDGAGLRKSPAFEDIVQAYTDLSEEIVAAQADSRHTRILQNTSGRRRLTVDFKNNSTTIEWLIDMPECPPEIPPNSFCQKIKASYIVLAVDVNDTDVTEVLARETQTAIYDGKLQEALDEVNPNSVLTIAELSAAPTMSPTGPPTSSSGLSTGAIVGIVVGGAVGMCCACVALCLSHKSHERT
jgi:hypothetical protein